ncbi:hypothetical protein PENTCL1PPCAC_13797, partial [Pristionchus entomophagus]
HVCDFRVPLEFDLFVSSLSSLEVDRAALKAVEMRTFLPFLLIFLSDLAESIDGGGRQMFDIFHRPVPKPIGFIGGEPLWSRAYERAEGGTARVVFDDDNTAYLMNERSSPRRSLRLRGDLKRVTAMDENNQIGRAERFSVQNLRRKLISA